MHWQTQNIGTFAASHWEDAFIHPSASKNNIQATIHSKSGVTNLDCRTTKSERK
jgi:hypothetical protein